jgi:hypothetical protein
MKIITIIMMLAFASHVSAQVINPPGPVGPLSPEVINPENGHIYLLLSQGDWTDSEAEAVALGGHLATIRNQAEEDWIYDFFGSYGGQRHDLWIGLHAVGQNNQYIWTNRRSLIYTDWLGGNPDDGDESLPYVAIMDFYFSTTTSWVTWDDVTYDFTGAPFNGVVEIDRKS